MRFLVDPYFRNPDMSDAQFVWCQEYISKKEAENRFPDKLEAIAPMAGTPNVMEVSISSRKL